MLNDLPAGEAFVQFALKELCRDLAKTSPSYPILHMTILTDIMDRLGRMSELDRGLLEIDAEIEQFGIEVLGDKSAPNAEPLYLAMLAHEAVQQMRIRLRKKTKSRR